MISGPVDCVHEVPPITLNECSSEFFIIGQDNCQKRRLCPVRPVIGGFSVLAAAIGGLDRIQKIVELL